jgi:membrane fusion protein (multidrug efflux system)
MNESIGPEPSGSVGTGKTSRRRSGGVIALIVALVAAAAGAYYLFAARSWQSTDDAMIKGDQIVVSAQLMAQITHLAAEEQSRVAKGQVLVRLDDIMLQAQEQQAVANNEYADQNISLAQTRLDQAQDDLDRATVQLKNKIIPQEQYEHMNIAYSAAQAQYKIAQAQAKQAEAQLAAVQANLSHTIIASPIDGVVAKKWTTVGNVVQPAQPIYTLYDLKDLWVEANFKETQIQDIEPGDPVEVTVDAFSKRSFTGKVDSIGTATAAEFSLMPPDNASGNFTKVTQRIPVKIVLDDPESVNVGPGKSLVSGMSVEVRVKTGRR